MRDPPTNRKGADPLTVAIRAHGNFIEGVPFALVIAAVAELNGANKLLLGGSLGLLFVSRVLHAEYGLLRNQYAAGAGRAIGTAVTQIFIVLWAFGSAYLVRDQIL